VEKKERLKRRKKRGEKGAAKKEKQAWRKRSGQEKAGAVPHCTLPRIGVGEPGEIR
jgi:hypothetical protein